VVEYIYVTFKNNESRDKATDLFLPEPKVHKCLRRMCCITNKYQLKKEFLQSPMDVTVSVDPDAILWENLSFTSKAQNWRRYAIQSVACVLTLVSGTVVMLLDWERAQALKRNPQVHCPPVEISAEDAYYDVQAYFPYGIMQCFCESLAKAEGRQAANQRTFEEYDPHGEDETPYCLEYSIGKNYTTVVVATSAVSIVAFNGIIARVFQALGEFQKKHTTTEQNIVSFFNIFSMEVCNMALILLVISFTPVGDIYGTPEVALYHGEGGTRLAGYSTFSADWYGNVGKVICLTVLLSCFAANSFDLRSFYYWLFRQLKDRNGSLSLKKFPHDQSDDKPNTKEVSQKELQRLYQGAKCSADRKVSRMMSTLFVVVAFSSGMPVMYILGALFFTLTYIINKVLFL
jgi:hypothetical protein